MSFRDYSAAASVQAAEVHTAPLPAHSDAFRRFLEACHARARLLRDNTIYLEIDLLLANFQERANRGELRSVQSLVKALCRGWYVGVHTDAQSRLAPSSQIVFQDGCRI